MKIGIIGVGPRGLSVLERILARVESGQSPREELQIVLVEATTFGSGRVWDPQQSEHFLMNTTVGFASAIPVGKTLESLVASSCSQSFKEWIAKNGYNYGYSLSDDDYAPRFLYGKYLVSLFEKIHKKLTALGVRVVLERVAARTLTKSNNFVLELANGKRHRLDSVVLSLGHLDSVKNEKFESNNQSAKSTTSCYLGKKIPNLVDYAGIASHENILVRGLGLNFFDLMAEVTIGRSGNFVEDNSSEGSFLKYLPSGLEPKIIGISRRGLPYRAKGEYKNLTIFSSGLKFYTLENVAKISKPELDFRNDLWPLIYRDMRYFDVIFNATDSDGSVVNDEAVNGDSSVESNEFVEILSNPYLSIHEIDSLFIDLAKSKNIKLGWQKETSLWDPFGETVFSSREEWRAAVKEYLREDIRGASLGENSGLRRAFFALFLTRDLTEHLLDSARVAKLSVYRDVMGWFSPMLHSLTAGPPKIRIKQLLALFEANVIDFLGPKPLINFDQEKQFFTAESETVAGGKMLASKLIEASSPANEVKKYDSKFLTQMLENGLVSVDEIVTEETKSIFSPGLRVNRETLEAVSRDSNTTRGLYVIGIQQTGLRFGTAIGPQAGGICTSHGRTLCDADTIAQNILRS